MATQEPEFTQEQQAYIDELRNTLRGEFESTATDPDHRKTTVEELEDLKTDALLTLRHTLRHSTNESVKAKVGMWTISTLLDAQRVGDDPLATFLKGMQDTAQTHPHEASSA